MTRFDPSRSLGRLLTAGLLGALALPAGLQAQPFRPEPMASTRKVVYDPDRDTCTPETITTAFHSHLRPWADQPPQVLERLRILQESMTRTSLSRCVQLGRMTPDQVRGVERSLGLSPSPLPTPPAVQTGSRP
jgi:hypothetical protein